MENCEEDSAELLLVFDSDEEELEEEEGKIGEKCISLLASLLPSASSILSDQLITKAISLELAEEQQHEGLAPLGMDTYDYPDPYPVQIRARPQVPPKPPIDTVRYSMNNIKESADWQLDELLEELEALETQLNTTNGGDQLLLGVSGIPSSSSRDTMRSTPHDLVSNAKHVAQPAPQFRQKMVNGGQHFSPNIHQISTNSMPSSCSSPDGDSAFGDSSSTESHRFRNSAFSSSNDSCRDSLNTPSPTQVSPRNGENSILSGDEAKALKIRQALEKMKEAKVTRIFVKFFVEDGQPLQMLIDERWTVADTMKQLAEKNHIALMEDHCIVEEFPELYIRRIYEDHEKVVENIQMWVQDSPNKLYFMRRPDKYTFIDRPELFLVTERTSDHMEVPAGDQWTRDSKQQFVKEYFGRDPVVPPEMEGFLYLKCDGRKSWKKHFFVLRTSGLYYSAKGKKSTKDLTCLMNLHSNQVYTGINWEKKYKSPTPYCVAIKLTALQIKRSQFIKYICAEDEMTWKRWLVALRIAKNGAELVGNFERACAIRREALSGGCDEGRAASVASSIRIAPISVNLRAQSPAGFSVVAVSPTEARYEEQPTGTIKRAPIDVLRRVSRTSSSSGAPTQEESDSDEEFPAPPAMVRVPPATPPKPAIKKTGPPPPPPKRAESTRLHTSTPTQHISDLEAALARRREKIGE